MGGAVPYPKKIPYPNGVLGGGFGGIVSGRRRGPGFGAGSAKVTGKLSAGIPGLLQHFDSSKLITWRIYTDTSMNVPGPRVFVMGSPPLN